MRNASWVLAAGLVSLAVQAGAAAPHFWVGFDAVESSGPNLRWVPVAVGSDETPAGARPYTFAARLTVTGPNGFACSAVEERTTKVKPPVTLALRFQVSYPSRGGPGGRREPPATTQPRATYRLSAKLTGDIQASHSFAFDFVEGGTASCAKAN
jgi:hypothetical protein